MRIETSGSTASKPCRAATSAGRRCRRPQLPKHVFDARKNRKGIDLPIIGDDHVNVGTDNLVVVSCAEMVNLVQLRCSCRATSNRPDPANSILDLDGRDDGARRACVVRLAEDYLRVRQPSRARSRTYRRHRERGRQVVPCGSTQQGTRLPSPRGPMSPRDRESCDDVSCRLISQVQIVVLERS